MKKKSLYLILLGALSLTSCGTSASYTNSSLIEDGIYYTPDYVSIRQAHNQQRQEIATLTQETKNRNDRTYTSPTDTIVLGETKSVTLPLELDKTYVVLMDGESYEERFNKFNDANYTFSINFDYSLGTYPYYYGWNGWYAPSYYGMWYDPWYSPWHYHRYDRWYSYWYGPSWFTWYGPNYPWGGYDPWYNPWYDPWYYNYHAPYYYYASHHSRDVIYGRRDDHTSATRSNGVRSTSQMGTRAYSSNSGAQQVRGTAAAQRTNSNGERINRSQGGNTQYKRVSGSETNKYRQSNSTRNNQTQSSRSGETSSSRRNNSSNSSYTRGETYNNSYNNTRSSYNSSSSGSSGRQSYSNSSSGGSRNVEGRR